MYKEEIDNSPYFSLDSDDGHDQYLHSSLNNVAHPTGVAQIRNLYCKATHHLKSDFQNTGRTLDYQLSEAPRQVNIILASVQGSGLRASSA